MTHSITLVSGVQHSDSTFIYMIIQATSYHHAKFLQYFDYIPYAIHPGYLFILQLKVCTFFFFERAFLKVIDQVVVNNNKILYREVNAQCTIISPCQA